MSLHIENKLNRIIFNKYYLIVTTANYRYQMYNLKKLQLNTIQLTFLSTTLSISILQDINKMLFLSNYIVI